MRGEAAAVAPGGSHPAPRSPASMPRRSAAPAAATPAGAGAPIAPVTVTLPADALQRGYIEQQSAAWPKAPWQLHLSTLIAGSPGADMITAAALEAVAAACDAAGLPAGTVDKYWAAMRGKDKKKPGEAGKFVRFQIGNSNVYEVKTNAAGQVVGKSATHKPWDRLMRPKQKGEGRTLVIKSLKFDAHVYAASDNYDAGKGEGYPAGATLRLRQVLSMSDDAIKPPEADLEGVEVADMEVE